MPLTPQQFEEHSGQCVMSEAEIRTFVEDIALIRLGLIVQKLNADRPEVERGESGPDRG